MIESNRKEHRPMFFSIAFYHIAGRQAWLTYLRSIR
jgi:hypothetical protein